MLRGLRGRARYVVKSGLQRRLRDFTLTMGRQDRFVVREDLARRFLTGDGIEIGPSVFPLRVPPGTRVRNVDRLSRAELMRAQSTTVPNPKWIPEIHVVDDAAQLATLADATVDFVVANHVLEHLEDPIGALHHWLRVIRPGGTLFLTLPDARYTFDAARSRTTVEHILRDHREGASVSRQAHYEEWARFVEGQPEDRIAERAAEFAGEDARHHYHVWELVDFLALVRAARLPCELEHAQTGHEEFFVLLHRT